MVDYTDKENTAVMLKCSVTMILMFLIVQDVPIFFIKYENDKKLDIGTRHQC